MATRLKDSYSQSDPRESLQIGFSLVVGFHLFIRILAPPHLWNKCFVWCSTTQSTTFNKLNIWPAHTHTHTHSQTRTQKQKNTHSQTVYPHLHLWAQADFNARYGSVCVTKCLKVPVLCQNHTPSNTQLYTHRHTHARTHTKTHALPPTHTLWFFQTLISKSCSSCFLLYLPLLSYPLLRYCTPSQG